MSKAGLAKDVKERPILFRPELVRAILAGVKTQTRRVINPQPRPTHHKPCQGCKDGGEVIWHFFNDHLSSDTDGRTCPYGKRGERLWVRETFYAFGKYVYTGGRTDKGKPEVEFLDTTYLSGRRYQYAADVTLPKPKTRYELGWHKRPAIFLPGWASRLSVTIRDVRVERLQDITEEDARAEGVDYMPSMPAALSHRTSFAKGWDKINGKRGFGWDKNPWVWVLSIKRVDSPPRHP